MQTFSPNIRLLDVQRDLPAVADLIEVCFSSTLDPDGRDYIRYIRLAAQDPFLRRSIPGCNERLSSPLAGYVWEENGVIAGNLTLIPFFYLGKWKYLIANVAVLPEYRGRGIARMLTRTAIEHSREQDVSAAWLQVRDDNPEALHIYLSLGFEEKARRTTWLITPDQQVVNQSKINGVSVSRRLNNDWPLQSNWLKITYPLSVAWNFLFDLKRYQPDFWREFLRWLNAEEILQWSARYHQNLIGVITWEQSHMYADNLWLAAHPDYEAMAMQSLLPAIYKLVKLNRPLSINYPFDRGNAEFLQAGFHVHNTLIWMEYKISAVDDFHRFPDFSA